VSLGEGLNTGGFGAVLGEHRLELSWRLFRSWSSIVRLLPLAPCGKVRDRAVRITKLSLGLFPRFEKSQNIKMIFLLRNEELNGIAKPAGTPVS